MGRHEIERNLRLDFEAANRARQAWRAYVLLTEDELQTFNLTRADLLALATEMDEHCRHRLGLPAVKPERHNV